MNSDDIINDFQALSQIAPHQWRERFPGHRPLGFLSGYVPEEIFHAAGFTPVFLFHGQKGHGYDQAHLPGFACWVIRSALDQALAGELSGWAGVAFTHTCDAIQALADLWHRAVPGLPVYYVAMPLHLTASAGPAYLRTELQRLRERLEQDAGQPLSDDALRRSIALYNRTRMLVQQLYEKADRLPASALHAVVRAAFLMPKELYNPLLAELLDGTSPSRANPSGPRLIVVGSELADPTLYQVIAETGAHVVDDLLDLGHRYFAHLVDERGDPLEALARQALASPPTPTKYHPQKRRDAWLLELVRARRADGVLFARQKFCDPHGFDFVTLKVALEEAGVPYLLIELEQTPHVGQLRTRVEAFVEMLEMRQLE